MGRRGLSLAAVLMAALGALLLIAPVAAQSITVRIDPPVSERGSSFVLTAEGLTPNERYVFDFVFVASGAVVFTTERIADSAGQTLISLRSDSTDELGDYRVEVRQDGVIVAEAAFSLVAPGAPPPAPAGAPGEVVLTVEPAEGPVRQNFVIRATGLEPGSAAFITVRETATNVVTYDREWTANAAGEVSVTLFTTLENAPGAYTVDVSDSRGSVLASATFTLLGLQGREAQIRVARISDAPLVFSIAISQAQPFTDLTIDIIDPDTRRSIFERIVRTNVEGLATVEFPLPPDLPLKPFRIVLRDTDGEITRSEIPLSATQSPDPLRVRVVPESGAIGQVFSIAANGLPLVPQATIRVLDGDTVVAEYTPRINRRGSTSITFPSALVEGPGIYVAEVEVEGEVLGRVTFEVLAQVLPPAITVEPASGPRGTVHTVTVEHLTPGTIATVRVSFGELEVLTTSREVDDTGTLRIDLQSEPTDEPGTYTLDVLVGHETVASSTLEITAEAAPPAAALSITPDRGPEGTTHLVEVSGLPASTPLDVEVLFAGEVVFEITGRSSDEEGRFSVRLMTEPEDAAGVYTVNILLDGALAASGEFTLLRDVAPIQPPAQQPVVDVLPNVRENEIFTGELTRAAPRLSFDLAGRGGEVVEITLSSDDFDSYLTLFDSQGFEIASNDDFDGLDSRIIVTLPYDDDYTIEVTSYSHHHDLPPPGEGAFTLAVTRIVPTPVFTGVPVRMAFGEEDAYFLLADLDATRTYTLSVAGAGLDTSIEVISPFGAFVGFDDDSGAGLDPELLGFAPFDSGAHTIVVRTLQGGAAGSAVLTITETALPTLGDGAQTVTTGAKALRSSVTFEGAAGTTVTLVVERLSGSTDDLSVVAVQDGTQLMSYSNAFGNVDAVRLPITVPADGIVIVHVSSFSGSATYRISVE